VPDVPSGSRSYPSSSIKRRMYKPVKVEHWDVKVDIEEFFERADKRKRAYNICVASFTRRMSKPAKMEGVTVAIILSELQHFLEKKQPQLKFRFSPQIPLGSIEKRKDETDELDKTDERGLNEGAKSSSELIEFCIMNPRADYILTLEEKNAVVVEVKNGGLGPDQGDPWHLHKAWTECSCPTGPIWPYPYPILL
jgi:hypothetical protein